MGMAAPGAIEAEVVTVAPVFTFTNWPLLAERERESNSSKISDEEDSSVIAVEFSNWVKMHFFRSAIGIHGSAIVTDAEAI
jgi:hypothetical protein